VRAARTAAGEASYPLPLPSAAPARADRAALLAQIDDYLLPRLARLDAPLLVVVGGSTGAGKSTLVNSLVRAPVSQAGVLRPTTRTPVLVCHPADSPWFRSGGPLGHLIRTAGKPPMISAPALRAGLAFVDVPDFDSVEVANREVAGELLAAADLWLFVTTATRYADAVPWQLLAAARQRGAVVALVLGRVPQSAGGAAPVEVLSHFTELLTAYGLATAPLFVVPETRTDGQGLLPDGAIGSLRKWLDGLSGDPAARASVARCTLDGALAALPEKLATLAAAAEEQVTAAEALAERVGMAYGGARVTVERTIRAPAPQPVRSGTRHSPAAHRRGPSGVRSWLDRIARPPATGSDQRRAWESRLVTLVCSAAADAAEQVRDAWLSHPAGEAMLGPELVGPPAGLAGKVERLARAWSGGTPEELANRIGELLDAEAARWLDGLAGVPPDGEPARRLREAATWLEQSRIAAALASIPAAVAPPAAESLAESWFQSSEQPRGSADGAPATRPGADQPGAVEPGSDEPGPDQTGSDEPGPGRLGSDQPTDRAELDRAGR